MNARPFVLLTQRVDVVPDYGERRDALDQAWIRLLSGIGCDAAAAPNDAAAAVALARRTEPAMVILSGGNGVTPEDPTHAPERNRAEAALLDWAAERNVKVLGVCRGLQFMNVHLGGRIHRVGGHIAKLHATDLTGTFGHVNSFHDFGIAPNDLAADLAAVAHAPDGTVEAAQHRWLPWFGVMWHPERDMPNPEGNRRWLASLIEADERAKFELA
jgi:gamma-glutamyl-gamma-aminobutyrate hydrolase PuuD